MRPERFLTTRVVPQVPVRECYNPWVCYWYEALGSWEAWDGRLVLNVSVDEELGVLGVIVHRELLE
jgi:hypothetical protein